MKQLHMVCVVAAAAFLVACGGGDGAPIRGSLVESAQPVAALSSPQIDASTAASGLQALSGKAKCDVRVVALNYHTVGVKGEQTNASGALLVPGGACTGPFPLVAYARGTSLEKPRTLANATDHETSLLIGMYAAQGYAVVATDYLGYAKSGYSFHPYVHADSEASTVIDSIRAARNAASAQGLSLSDKVMLTGYSQGGHASMATHRAIERDLSSEIMVVAGAHLAGPYNMANLFKNGVDRPGYQIFLPFMVTAWQKIYGDLYSNVTQAFKPPYSTYIETLLPSPTLTLTTVLTSGKLPYDPSLTPQQLLDLEFQSAFLTGATSSDNTLNQAARRQDLMDWSPKAKTLLCGGAGDLLVPPALHQVPMKAVFDSRGLTNVSSVDVDANVQAAYGPGGKAPTDPSSAEFATYYASYHESYERLFCFAQARAAFEAVK